MHWLLSSQMEPFPERQEDDSNNGEEEASEESEYQESV